MKRWDRKRVIAVGGSQGHEYREVGGRWSHNKKEWHSREDRRNAGSSPGRSRWVGRFFVFPNALPTGGAERGGGGEKVVERESFNKFAEE